MSKKENNNSEINIVQHEKTILHAKYIVAIALVVCLGNLVIKTYCQKAFVDQVSFAGTVTSIVLSVIAIWMSISGERTTNDIKMKITESSERLSGTTKELEDLNKNHKETMETQLNELTNVQEQLTKIIQSINNVEKQVSFIHAERTGNSNTINNNTMDSDQKIALFNNIYSWATGNNSFQELIFCKIADIIIQKNKNHIPFTFEEITLSLSQSGIYINYCMGYINTYWGIINTLLATSVFEDPKALNHILSLINKTLNSQISF